MKEFQTLKGDITKTRIFEGEIDLDVIDDDEIIVLSLIHISEPTRPC